MENLTSVLLNLDTTNISPSGMPAFSQPPSGADPLPVADLTDEQAETKEEEEEPILSNDPYIDTPLCTSCNECIQLNGALFHYNSDKMAYIADPRSGTFKELVEAAEMCPVGIIHPGSPLNTNEANLDELMKRAEKFN
jgi:ferredoxin